MRLLVGRINAVDFFTGIQSSRSGCAAPLNFSGLTDRILRKLRLISITGYNAVRVRVLSPDVDFRLRVTRCWGAGCTVSSVPSCMKPLPRGQARIRGLGGRYAA